VDQSSDSFGHRLENQLDHLTIGKIDGALDRQRQGDLIYETLRFSTFFYTIEEVGRKLQRMADLL
jgi:hypothetical protein